MKSGCGRLSLKAVWGGGRVGVQQDQRQRDELEAVAVI